MSEMNPSALPAPKAPQSPRRPPGPLPSSAVVIQSPLSYTGSALRLWKLLGRSTGLVRALAACAVLCLIGLAWAFVTVWYLTWGLLLVPWRLLRRGSRRRRRDALRHAELVAALRRDGEPW